MDQNYVSDHSLLSIRSLAAQLTAEKNEMKQAKSPQISTQQWSFTTSLSKLGPSTIRIQISQRHRELNFLPRKEFTELVI